MFKVIFLEGWDRFYSKMDKPEKDRIMKKIEQLPILAGARHLKHGVPNFVTEAGQYRVCFREEGDMRAVIFAGNHKQYEKWYKRQ